MTVALSAQRLCIRSCQTNTAVTETGGVPSYDSALFVLGRNGGGPEEKRTNLVFPKNR